MNEPELSISYSLGKYLQDVPGQVDCKLRAGPLLPSKERRAHQVQRRHVRRRRWPLGHFCLEGSQAPTPCPAKTRGDRTGLRDSSACTNCTDPSTSALGSTCVHGALCAYRLGSP